MIEDSAKIPKVFVSHASADKERFVLPFAEKLRAAGINAWVDQWEMLPGDSVIEKIWEEGLKACDAFVVVLSEESLSSRWVQEELNSGFVKRIQDRTRLIPVRLDNAKVPEVLRAIVWIDIDDLRSYGRQFERIVNAIHGQYTRPPLGPRPAHICPDVAAMDGLAPIDSTIFERACRISIEQGHPDSISGKRLVAELNRQGISEAQIVETQQVLERQRYIQIFRVLGPPHAYDFSITSFGFDQFARTRIADYGKLCADVARLLVRHESMNNHGVAEALGMPIRIAEHILESLEGNGLIKFSKSIGGGLHLDVYWVSPELRRELEG